MLPEEGWRESVSPAFAVIGCPLHIVVIRMRKVGISAGRCATDNGTVLFRGQMWVLGIWE